MCLATSMSQNGSSSGPAFALLASLPGGVSVYTGLVFNEWSALLWQAGTGCLSVGGGASHVSRLAAADEHYAVSHPSVLRADAQACK